ncbi:MAG: transglutaminase-like domain-containing protein, partial [Clostridia bacterium]|nr:transglutaminase-like domain-containing protein [Clostridia bacterium]
MKRHACRSLILILVLIALTPLGTCAETRSITRTPLPVSPARQTVEIVVGVPNPEVYPSGKARASLAKDAQLTAEARDIYANFLARGSEFYLYGDDFLAGNYGYDAEKCAFIVNLARQITAGCSTAAEKIRAVASYASDKIYYDYDYYEGRKPDVHYDPYACLYYGYTVCGGYAMSVEALLQAVGVPCGYVSAPNHAFNIAWDGRRWLLFDTTWCSYNVYRNGQKQYGGYSLDTWYDYTFEFGLTQYNHIVSGMPLTIVNGKLKQYP